MVHWAPGARDWPQSCFSEKSMPEVMICSSAMGALVGLLTAIARGRVGESTRLSPKSMLRGVTCNPVGEVCEKVGADKQNAAEISMAAGRSLNYLFPCGDFASGLVPNRAVPMRMQVAPSSIAISKSCDIPMESTSMWMAGNFRAAI